MSCGFELGHSQKSILHGKDSNTSACGSNTGVSDGRWTSYAEAFGDTYSLRIPECIDRTSPFPAEGVPGFDTELQCQERGVSKQPFQTHDPCIPVPWPQVLTATPRAAAASLLIFSGTYVPCQ